MAWSRRSVDSRNRSANGTLRKSPRRDATSRSHLNGTTIVDANLDDVKDEEMLKTHRDLSKPEGSRGIANTKGHIGFLGHGARVEFRNIRIKEL
jgi:hypothetical protein